MALLVVAVAVGLTGCGGGRQASPGATPGTTSPALPSGPASASAPVTGTSTPSAHPASPSPTPLVPPVVTPTGGTRTSTPRADRAVAFRGLGSWVDVRDYGALTPTTAVAAMRSAHVRTLYLSTARYDSSADIADPSRVDAWLAAAHAAGIRVVGWYVPDFGDLARDVRRTLAVARYRSQAGQRFDAVGVDIEYPLQVPSPAAWNAAVARLLTQVRAGTTAPLGAITLPPLLMAAWPDPGRWAGFPWSTIGHTADVELPMSYWTSYTPAKLCPTDPRYCVTEYTSTNVIRSRQLTGLPIHVIGGVGDAATSGEVNRFVGAAGTVAVVGGSLYDYRTTSSADWAALQGFR